MKASWWHACHLGAGKRGRSKSIFLEYLDNVKKLMLMNATIYRLIEYE